MGHRISVVCDQYLLRDVTLTSPRSEERWVFAPYERRGRNSPYASSARSELYAILQQLAVLKSKRRRRDTILEV